MFPTYIFTFLMHSMSFSFYLKSKCCVSCRVPCVTCCGQILMTAAVGASLPEALATPLARTSRRPSTMPMGSRWCPAPISWSWRYDPVAAATRPYQHPRHVLVDHTMGVQDFYLGKGLQIPLAELGWDHDGFISSCCEKLKQEGKAGKLWQK